MSQTKKHCEPLVAVWLRPSTTEPCICCKQVAVKPRGEHLKNDVCKLEPEQWRFCDTFSLKGVLQWPKSLFGN